MLQKKRLAALFAVVISTAFAAGAVVPSAFAASQQSDRQETWRDNEVAARSDGEGNSRDLGDSLEDFDCQFDFDAASGEGTERPSDDSEDGMPPNPQHMWSPENLTGEDAIMTLSSGPWWSGKNFYNGYGNLWCANAKMVIDVSEWEPNINWSSVKNSGVDGAILRIGFGGTNGKGREDYQFANNINGVRSVGMPYGIYLYSYAYDADFARSEANLTADLLDKYNCHDFSLPIYYDIECFATWSGHSAPSSAVLYEQIIRTYIDTMAARGYRNVEVYTYRSYLQNELNTPYIWGQASWVAEYDSNLNVTNNYYSGNRGWQYTDAGSVDGISGDVDISAFTGFGDGGINVTGLEAVAISDGEYYIDSELVPSSGVDMRDGGTKNGTATQLYRANGSAAQKFTFTRQSDGSYVIKNTVSGRVLDVSAGDAGNGAKVQLWDDNGSKAQRWFIRDSGSGYYLQSALGNWVLDINGGSAANSTSITLYIPNGSDAQKFMLASTDEGGIVADASVVVTLADNDGYAIDIAGGSIDNGAVAQLYANNGTEAQLFVFHRVGNGIYSVRSVRSGKMLDVWCGGTVNSTIVDQYQDNGTAAQRWCVRNYGDNGVSLVNLKSGKALDVRSAALASGTPLQIYSVNGTAAQRWKLIRTLSAAERASQMAKDHKGSVASGSYFVKSAKDDTKVLDAAGGAISCGTNAWLYQKNGTSAQRWFITEDDDGYLTFINENSGLALDVSGGDAGNGANVQLYTPNATKAQKWIAQKSDDGLVTIVSALNTDYSLDLCSGQTANQTNVQLFVSNGTAAQKFVLEETSKPVPDGTYTILSTKNRNTAIDVEWGSVSDGANVWLYDVNGTAAQQWKAENNADGTMTLVNVKSNKALDIFCCNMSSGANVWQYAPNGSTAQKWVPISNGDGTVTLRSAGNPALVLDVSAGQTVNGANIQVYSRNSTLAQSFIFKTVGQ